MIILNIFKKKHEAVTDNPSIRIYINKIEDRITFKIRTGYYLKLLMPEMIKLLGSTKSKITKDENDENVPHLEITEVVLIHWNIVNNDYQQYSRALYKYATLSMTIFHQKMLYSFFIFSYYYIKFLLTFNSEFSYIEVWFTDQNSKPIELEDKTNITLIINWSVKYKNDKIFGST